jgi:uncharacterized protein UPF0547
VSPCLAAVMPNRTLRALEAEGITKAMFMARALYFGGGCFFAGFFVVVGTDPLDAVWIITGLVLLYLVGLAGYYVARRAAARYRVCPDCAETIKVAANVCRHCGYRFTESPAHAPTPPPPPASPQPNGEAAISGPSAPAQPT